MLSLVDQSEGVWGPMNHGVVGPGLDDVTSEGVDVWIDDNQHFISTRPMTDTNGIHSERSYRSVPHSYSSRDGAVRIGHGSLKSTSSVIMRYEMYHA